MIQIELRWNRYKGNGKAWLAKKIGEKLVFFQENSFKAIEQTKRSIYGGIRYFIIKEDGDYVAEEVYTKTYSIRYFFTVKEGKIKDMKAVYANGFYRGKELKQQLNWKEVSENEV
jgi:hypothetical protein